MRIEFEIEKVDFLLLKLVPGLKDQGKQERFERIKFLLKRGFIFPPFEKEFLYPFATTLVSPKEESLKDF